MTAACISDEIVPALFLELSDDLLDVLGVVFRAYQQDIVGIDDNDVSCTDCGNESLSAAYGGAL